MRHPKGVEIERMLVALKAGLDATAIGILDGARSWLHASSEASPGAFWSAFNGAHWVRPDWDSWEKALLASGRARVDCGCGHHFVESFTIRGLWVLIVLGTDALTPGAEQVVAHAVPLLAPLLPTIGAKTSSAPPTGGPGGGGQGPAELGIPVWWIRKRTSD